MTDVAEIVASLMSELIQAQKQSTELSKDIAENQKSDPIMRMLPIPGIRINTFDLELNGQLDKTRIQALSKTHLSKTNLKAAADTAQVLKTLTAQLEKYSKSVQAHLAPAVESSPTNKRSGSNKPRFVVDRNVLSKVTPELISTLKMTLSLDEYEWIESDC